VPNIYDADLSPTGEYRRARVAEAAGAVHLGMTVYELAPGQGMVFHYHVQREELLVVAERRFGALFSVDDAVSDYGGGHARIIPPA
jgi:hypothetical protein